jgi:hypothetical protein
VTHKPFSCQIGNCIEWAGLFEKMRRAANDIEALFGFELVISPLVKLDHRSVHLSDDEECGSLHLRQ